MEVDISEATRQLLPPDLRADGFENTAYNLTVDLKHVEAYTKLAEIVANRIDIGKFAGGCAELTDAHIKKIVKRILRGPLTEHETGFYLTFADSVVSSGGNYSEAVRYVVEAILQSPRFIEHK